MRRGFLIGGNWIIDQVKVIDVYPEEEKLASISAEYNSNGGSAYNVLKNLFKLKVDFPLEGIGLVGNDERGEAIIADCAKMGIITNQIYKTSSANTSYTDVMSVKGTGKRTFFHQHGANALLDIDHFDFLNSSCKIFHLGYLLLLDKLDHLDAEGQSGASKVLMAAKNKGFITSVDIVSENSSRFQAVIPSSLPYVDYLFINEFEAQMLSGISTTDEQGVIGKEQCKKAAECIVKMGVGKWVILHFPEGVIAISSTGEQIFKAGLNIPAADIIGAVGAGDAFASGVLYGIHENWSMERCLELGVCAAASCLFKPTCSDGILPVDECLKLQDLYGFR
jgi:sugar/nucleoside kinase (ribokinase family)